MLPRWTKKLMDFNCKVSVSIKKMIIQDGPFRWLVFVLTDNHVKIRLGWINVWSCDSFLSVASIKKGGSCLDRFDSFFHSVFRSWILDKRVQTRSKIQRSFVKRSDIPLTEVSKHEELKTAHWSNLKRRNLDRAWLVMFVEFFTRENLDFDHQWRKILGGNGPVSKICAKEMSFAKHIVC